MLRNGEGDEFVPAMWSLSVRVSETVVSGDCISRSKSGATRSCGRNDGVSALATFSASTFCRAWCHSILVRNIDRIGMSESAIVVPFVGLERAPLGRLCRVYG